MDNEILVGMVMLFRVGGKAVVVKAVNRDRVRIVYVSRFFGMLEAWIDLSALTTNPALVVQNIGGN